MPENTFKESLDLLVWLDKFEQQQDKKLKSPVDSWKNSWEVREWRKLHRRLLRDRMLPKDRVCAHCKQFKSNPRSWPGGKEVYASFKRFKREEEQFVLFGKGARPSWELLCTACKKAERVGEAATWYRRETSVIVDARTVNARRRELGISQMKLSALCGWRQPKQCKLESRDRRLPESDAMKLQAHLQLVELPGSEPHDRWVVLGPGLQATRKALGLPRSSLAAAMGSSLRRVSELEGKAETVVGPFAVSRLESLFAGITGL